MRYLPLGAPERMLRGVIRAWRYVDGRDGREEVDCPHIREAVDPEHAVVWIDATSPEDEEALHSLKAELGLSATVVDAILNPRERTKLMRYGDYFHVAVHDCACVSDTVDSREIDIVTGPGWLVTVRHPSDNGSQVDLDEVARRFEMQRTEHHADRGGLPVVGTLRRDRRPLLRGRRHHRRTARRDRRGGLPRPSAAGHPPDDVRGASRPHHHPAGGGADARSRERHHPQGDRLRRRSRDRATSTTSTTGCCASATSSSRSATS